MGQRELQRLEQLFAQDLVPGRDQQSIIRGLIEVERILNRAESNDTLTWRRARLHLESLIDTAYLHLLNPRSQHDKKSLQEILEISEEVYSRGRKSEQKGLIVEANNATQSMGAELFEYIPYGLLHVDQVEEMTRELAAKDVHALPEKTYQVKLDEGESDTLWNLTLVGADKAWNKTKGGGVRVGVCDTGCDYKHPELKDRFGETKGYNFVNYSSDPMDDNGHGTHVSGTIAGQTTGVAPRATLYALKFLNKRGSGKESGFIRSAEWAIKHNLNVLNGSFGSHRGSRAEKAICDALKQKGVVFVAAAGNDGTSSHHYPASYESVISVAAVDKHKKRASFSQKNDQVNISAPGVNIYSAWPHGTKRVASGTSMATPHVAGALALLMSKGNTSGAWSVLAETAEQLGPANEYGKGLIRLDKAFRLAEVYQQWIS